VAKYTIQNAKYLIPSTFTILAMLASFYAILQAASGGFIAASYGVIAAMVFDSLDGRSARLTNTCTAFGASFDSIADMMAYGVAPAIMMYCWGLFRLGKLGYLVCFIFCACAGLRLARFNVMLAVVDKKYFQGLSSTIAGGFVVSFILGCSQFGWYNQKLVIVAAILTFISALLMVSNIRFFSFKVMGMSKGLTMSLLILFIIAAILLIIFLKGLAVFAVLACYIGIALILHVLGVTRPKQEPTI
jgi:CDP-diacylglycerol--serine O-phosphatidyltransferase